MTSNNHIQKVHEWVDRNVQKFITPKKIIIDEIEFDWNKFCGSFSLQLDEIRISERYSISLSIDGKYEYCGPMFISPLGAPASFEAISLTDETEIAITNALNKLFPRMASFGLHPISKEFINSSTPISKRILDKTAIENLKQLISSQKAKIELTLD